MVHGWQVTDRTQDFAAVIRETEPGGLDAVIDGTMRVDTIKRSLALQRRGGRLVSYGEPAAPQPRAPRLFIR